MTIYDHCSICGCPVSNTLHVVSPDGRIYCFECLYRVKDLMDQAGMDLGEEE